MYTYENWKAFLKAYGLQAEDIAEIIGKSKQNVYQQISPNKPLPTWARAMLFVHNRAGATFTVQADKITPELSEALTSMATKALGKFANEHTADELKNKIGGRIEIKDGGEPRGFDGDFTPEPGEALAEMVGNALMSVEKTPLQSPQKDCGCRMEGRFFKRGKNCYKRADEHKF